MCHSNKNDFSSFIFSMNIKNVYNIIKKNHLHVVTERKIMWYLLAKSFLVLMQQFSCCALCPWDLVFNVVLFVFFFALNFFFLVTFFVAASSFFLFSLSTSLGGCFNAASVYLLCKK